VDLVVLILVVALVGFLVWAIITHIPMPPMFKLAIQIIVVIALVLYLIRRFGGLPNVL
jgi:uncharacterized membrane protein (DUF2068 family)